MRILIVLTNVAKTDRRGMDTGFHFAEFTHAFDFFKGHGYEVIVGSPKGGKCTITSDHPGDKINESFKNNPEEMRLIEDTKKLTELKGQRFDAVYIAGGHGAMFDLANNDELASILATTHDNGGIVASVCHGPAALIGVKSASGDYLVNGRRITSFTNDEEKATPFFNEIPFLLQSKLTEQGALFESSSPRKAHLAVDTRVITGQNPESIELVIGTVHALLTKSEEII
jgi:putative intracellular protease/amidase